MQIPLQITIRDMPPSDALEAKIREKATRLENLHSRITSCRVLVEKAHRHQRQGERFHVRLDLRVPGHEIVATRDDHEDVYVALRDAFNAAERQLEEAVPTKRVAASKLGD